MWEIKSNRGVKHYPEGLVAVFLGAMLFMQFCFCFCSVFFHSSSCLFFLLSLLYNLSSSCFTEHHTLYYRTFAWTKKFIGRKLKKKSFSIPSFFHLIFSLLLSLPCFALLF